MQLEVTLDGRKKLLDTTKAIDRALVKGVRAELAAGARLVRRDARRILTRHRFTGNLEDSIRVRTWRDYLSATVFVLAPHKYLAAHGRKPGKMPDLRGKSKEVLLAYMRARGIPEKNLYIFARALGRKGTKPLPAFMQIPFALHERAINNGIRVAVDRVFETEGGTR
jgi:hypothetical protein